MSKKLSWILEAAIEDGLDEAKNYEEMKEIKDLVSKKIEELMNKRGNSDDERNLELWADELGESPPPPVFTEPHPFIPGQVPKVDDADQQTSKSTSKKAKFIPRVR